MSTAKQTVLFETLVESTIVNTDSWKTGLVEIMRMMPDEYENDGKNQLIQYSFSASRFGKILIASTSKGICYMAFEEEEEKELNLLQSLFPNVHLIPEKTLAHQNALSYLDNPQAVESKINLHLKGTDFQFKVWEILLKIPFGKTTTYGKLAASIGNPKGSRAVGTAIGSNPVAYLIPCHRVVQASGALGGYRWGLSRKSAIIQWELTNIENNEN